MLGELRKLMARDDIDWFVVFSEDGHLSEYTGESDKYREALSNFTGSAGVLVVNTQEAFLWTDSRYFVQAKKELCGSGIELVKYGLHNVKNWDEYLADHVWEGQSIAFDHMTLSYKKYKDLKEKLPKSVVIYDGRNILKECVTTLPKRSFGTIQAAPVSFAGKTASDKLSALRRRIEEKYTANDSYSYVLSDLTSIMWLFNLRGSDIDHVPVAYSYAIVTKYTATLYASRKNIPGEVHEELQDNGINVKEYSLFYKDINETATDIVLADPYTNNCRILLAFEDNGMLSECRDVDLIRKHIKNSSEINGMRNAHLKDAVTMIRFIKKIKEMAVQNALTDEYETGRMLDDMRKNNGSCQPSFQTICAYGPNSAIVHYTASKDGASFIKPTGFLLVDSGGQYAFEGTTDITRTIPLGTLTEEEKKVYTIVLKGNLRLMNMIFPEGYKGSLLDAVAETPLWENGYFCGHGIGHGVGAYLSVHESVARISRGCSERETPFFPGVIVSDEPGVYLEGKFGVRLENLLLTVKAKANSGYSMCRFEALTLVPFDKDAIDFDILSDEEIDILLHYNKLIEEKVFPLLDEDERVWAKEYMNF